MAHSSCSPTYAGATVRRRTPVEWEIYDNFVATGNLNPVVCGSLSQVRQTSRRRFSAALEAQSTVLRGGVRSWANHSGEFARRQTSGRTNMSAKIFALWTGEFPSATWPASQRLAKQNSFLRSAPAATRDRAADGCAASARRPVRSMRWSPTSSLGLNDECRSESNQRQSRNGCGAAPRKTIYRRNGVVNRRVAARTATATSEFMDVTAGETARIQLRTALLQHLRGDGALSDVGSGAVRSHEGRAA